MYPFSKASLNDGAIRFSVSPGARPRMSLFAVTHLGECSTTTPDPPHSTLRACRNESWQYPFAVFLTTQIKQSNSLSVVAHYALQNLYTT